MNPLPLWHKDLTPDLQRHAELTLGETSDRKAKALVDFRRLINGKTNIYSRVDDVFLLRFLRTKKYNVQKAFKVYLNYYSLLNKQKGIFTGRLPSEFRHVIAMNNIMYVPHRLPSGSHVGIYKIGAFDLQKGTLQDLFAVTLIIGEMILDCEPTQVSGGIFIIDLKNATISHYRQIFTLQFISLVISMVQDCLPERLAGVHIVNEPMMFYTFWRVVKTLLKKKLSERIHFHGCNFENLHKQIPRNYLPEEYGGTLGKFDNSELAKYFFGQEHFMERINKYGHIKNATLS